MARFVTIGYGDQAGYERTDVRVREVAHQQDQRLEAAGAVIGVAGDPIQVRNPDAEGLRTNEGPFMRSDLPVAGFALIEAPDIDAAVALVSTTPCSVAHGVVEVWPLETFARAVR